MLQLKMYIDIGHIAPLARFVDLYDKICVFIAYKSTFIVVNESHSVGTV